MIDKNKIILLAEEKLYSLINKEYSEWDDEDRELAIIELSRRFSHKDKSYSIVLGTAIAAKALLAAKAAFVAHKTAIAAGAAGTAIGAAIGANRRVRKESEDKKLKAGKLSLAIIRGGLKAVRGGIVAAKVTAKGLSKKLNDSEKTYLKDSGKNIAKTSLNAVGLTAAAVAPIPGTEIAYLAAMKKYPAMRNKDAIIPKEYKKNKTWNKAHKWIDKKSKNLDSAIIKNRNSND